MQGGPGIQVSEKGENARIACGDELGGGEAGEIQEGFEEKTRKDRRLQINGSDQLGGGMVGKMQRCLLSVEEQASVDFVASSTRGTQHSTQREQRAGTRETSVW